jgi:hypothetical protein
MLESEARASTLASMFQKYFLTDAKEREARVFANEASDLSSLMQ